MGSSVFAKTPEEKKPALPLLEVIPVRTGREQRFAMNLVQDMFGKFLTNETNDVLRRGQVSAFKVGMG